MFYPLAFTTHTDTIGRSVEIKGKRWPKAEIADAINSARRLAASRFLGSASRRAPGQGPRLLHRIDKRPIERSIGNVQKSPFQLGFGNWIVRFSIHHSDQFAFAPCLSCGSGLRLRHGHTFRLPEGGNVRAMQKHLAVAGRRVMPKADALDLPFRSHVRSFHSIGEIVMRSDAPSLVPVAVSVPAIS
jgi:hypothetical protein